MDRNRLLSHFRASYHHLFLNSALIERQHLDGIVYQSAPTQSRFANMAVNTKPHHFIADKTIEMIDHYFSEKNLNYTWIIHEDDESSLFPCLVSRGFELLCDIECLCYEIKDFIPEEQNINIRRIQNQDRERLIDFVPRAFEGAQVKRTAT